MQATIYYKASDEYLIKKLQEKSTMERKSKSACLLSILEQYFEAKNRVGEILSDLGAVSSDNLRKALEKQKEENHEKKIGEILVEENYVREVDLDRALEIQKNY